MHSMEGSEMAMERVRSPGKRRNQFDNVNCMHASSTSSKRFLAFSLKKFFDYSSFHFRRIDNLSARLLPNLSSYDVHGTGDHQSVSPVSPLLPPDTSQFPPNASFQPKYPPTVQPSVSHNFRIGAANAHTTPKTTDTQSQSQWSGH